MVCSMLTVELVPDNSVLVNHVVIPEVTGTVTTSAATMAVPSLTVLSPPSPVSDVYHIVSLVKYIYSLMQNVT